MLTNGIFIIQLGLQVEFTKFVDVAYMEDEISRIM